MLPPAKKQRLSNNFTSFGKFFKLQMDDYTMTDKMEYTEDQIKDVTSFCDFYIDFIHNFNEKLKYFLSEDIVLDYFGQTIKGQKNVTSYIMSNIVNVTHLFRDIKPTDKIGFRETHIVKLPKEPKAMLPPFFSPPKNIQPKTPTKSRPSTSGPKRVQTDSKSQLKEGCSPVKRLRVCRYGEGDNSDLLIDTDICESEGEPIHVKYMVAEGYVEFRKPSMKKLQTECKWKRPCKLSIAYSSTANQDCTIYLIIYEGNVRCRRNLLKEFERAESS